MKCSFAFFIFFMSLTGCHEHEKKTFIDALPSIKNDSGKLHQTARNDSLKNYLSLNSDTLLFHLTMDTAHQHIPVRITVTSGQKLFAILSSNDKNANIRISQIEYPDSTFDGPFGRDIHCAIKDTGSYKIIIAEDMMAGARWNGDFTLKTWVK